MAISRFVISAISSAFMILNAGLSHSQNYPTRPVRIVAGDPGGAGDFAARLIAQGTSVTLGQPVIVDNRGNSTGVVVSKALPDGYTVLVDSGGFWISPFIQKMSYDVLNDFTPLAMLTLSPNVLVVNPGLAATSIKELIALAKSKPGVLNFASAGQGSTPHLGAELFKSMAGLNIVHVPYKGAGPAVIDLIGGQVQLMVGSAPSVMPNVRSGKLRALGVGTQQPTALVPGVPTVASAGLPGYEAATLMGMFAPTKTPTAIINRLNQDVARSLNQPEVKEKLFNAGSDVVASTPGEFDTKLKSELAKWGKLIKDVGIGIN